MRIFAALASSVVLFLALGSSAAAQSPRVLNGSYDDQIQGLGERFPSAKDISKNHNFRVYKFTNNGINYVQINSHDGDVLTAFALYGKSFFILPIGSLTESQVSIKRNSLSASGTQVTAAAECPCSAVVVYDGPEGRIIVVYGINGEVIQVFFLPKPGTQLPN